MTEYNAPQIIAFVKAGKGPSGLFSGSDQAAKMSQLHQEIAQEMQQLQGAMEQHWEGDAAGKAYSGAGPLVQASQVSGEHLAKAQNLYTGQGNSYQPLKSTVDSVGDLGERPSDDWVSDTPLSFLSNRSDEIAKWDEKAKRVVDSYSTYHGQSTDNSGQWPQQYGELGLPPSGADIKPKTDDGTGPGPGPVQPGPGRKRTGEPGGETVSPPGGGSRHDVSGLQDTGGPTGNDTKPGEHKPGEQSGSTGDGQTHTPTDTKPSQTTGTTPTEYLPPNTPSGIPPKDPTYTPTGYGNPNGPSNGPGAFPVTGGGGYDSARGGAGTGKPGAGGPGGNLGGGKGSGVGTFGQQGPAVGARPGAIAGRPGAPGMGGAPMGRGQKEEDSEHERPDYLIEEDPDDAFVGELPKTTPPVIGA